MRKLKLEIETLVVESFDTRAAEGGAGTVHGHASYPLGCHTPPDSYPDTCDYATCAGMTCWESCNGTCDCGTVGCPRYTDFTNCPEHLSCMYGCHPTGGENTCYC